MSDSQAVSGQVLADFCNLTTRRIQQLTKDGVMHKASNGDYLFLESAKGYIKYLQDISASTKQSANDLQTQKLEEEVRRLKRENDEADGISVQKQDLLPFFRNYSKQVNREFDSIEGQLDGTLIECSSCDSSMRLDGRGRQRIRETVIRIKNHLDDLHNNLEGAKS